MSRIYATAISISPVTAGAAAAMCDLESSATESPALLAVDINAFIGSTETLVVGLGLASNTPVPSFSIPFAPEYPNDPPCTSILATAWSVAPAAPTNFFRAFRAVESATATVGYYQLLTFPRGLKISPSSSLVLWNSNANTFAHINLSWEIEV